MCVIGCSPKSMEGLFQEGFYKVKRIRRIDNNYLIYATRNDSTFLILSPASELKRSNSHEELQVGNKYHFELEVLFPLDSIGGIAIAPNLGIVYPLSLREGIKLRKKTHYTIYHSNNLDGIRIRNE